MNWLWLLIRDPAAAFDWYDHRSGAVPRMDHAKVVPDLVLASLLVMEFLWSPRTRQLPSIWVLSIDLTAAFGQSAWRQWWAQKPISGTTATTASTSLNLTGDLTEILRRREAGGDLEHTP